MVVVVVCLSEGTNTPPYRSENKEPERLGVTPVHEHLHKCRGRNAQARATTPSLTPRLGWVAC